MVIALLVAGLAAAVVVFQMRRVNASHDDLMRTEFARFHADGGRVKPQDLLEQIGLCSEKTLRANNGYFEFYPNERIIMLRLPDDKSAYCYCNLMEYLDLTRAIERKIQYGKNPPFPPSSAAA